MTKRIVAASAAHMTHARKLSVRMEHRWGVRVNVEMAVHINGGDASTASLGQLRNVSLSGAWIVTGMHAHRLQRLSVTLSDPNRKARKVTLAGYVVRQTDQGVGVEWCTYAPQVVSEIVRKASVRPIEPLESPSASERAAVL